MKLVTNVLTALYYTTTSLILLFLLSSWISRCFAADAVELNSLSMEIMQYTPNGVDPLISTLPGNHSPDKYLSLKMNISVFKYGYFDSTVHTTTDKSPDQAGQFRTVGWLFELGGHLSDKFDVYYQHHSMHVMDAQSPIGHFPVLDSVGIRLFLYKK